jgi:hypothetical protein
MNMLPRALYGTTDWKAALRNAIETGAPRCVSGGTVEGHAFYCAAIFGSPALWAPAREAMRTGKLSLAWTYGRRALRRAFSGKIRVELDGGKARKSEALVLISPMISRAVDEPDGLEAAAMDPADAAQAFRLAATALFMLGYGAHLCQITWNQSVAEFPGLPVGVVYMPIPVAGFLTLLFLIERVFT